MRLIVPDYRRLALRRPEVRSGKWIGDSQWRQFEEYGYMAVRDVVPAGIVNDAVREIAAFVGADLSDSRTWYTGAPVLDGLVPLHHAQGLWDIRQCESLYEVFAEFFGTGRLMVDMNRCLFRPPVHPNWPGLSHGTIHWDTDPRSPEPDSLQAVVLLTDVGRDSGGFQCIPEVYQHLDGWLQRYACHSSFDFFNPGLNHWNATQVKGKAGDVILWSSRLPHGTASNLSDRPRIAAFVTMQPPGDDPRLRKSMKIWWLSKRAPDYWRGLPGQLDPSRDRQPFSPIWDSSSLGL